VGHLWRGHALILAVVSLFGASASVAAAAEGTAEDTSPVSVSLTPKVHHQQSVFVVPFEAAQAKERRFITSLLTVKDTTARLFLGQELSCTSPSGATVAGIETGRNFWQDGLGATVASFVLRVNEAGQWTCTSTVNVCEPGKCSSGTGSGTLTLDADASTPLSVMKVSAPLDLWSTSTRLLSKDIALRPGKAVTLSKTVQVGKGSSPAVVAEVSFSNCIEADYPDACGSLPSRKLNGSATASISMTATQIPSTPGTTCSSAKATRGQGAVTRTISAQQHHATFSMEIPKIQMSTAPGCSNKLQISATVKSIKGNGIAVESGSRKKPMSLVSVGQIDSSYQVVPVLSAD
jgi:hypothetical protein